MLGQIYNQNARGLGDLNLFGVGETSQEVTLELGVNARLGAEYQGLKGLKNIRILWEGAEALTVKKI